MGPYRKFRFCALTAFAVASLVLTGISPEAQAAPIDIANLQLWLDAQDVNGNGSPFLDSTVSVWEDKSGNNRDAVQASSAFRPAYISDGGPEFSNFPIIRFDGSNDFLQLPSGFMFNEAAFTMFVLHKTPYGPSNANQAIFGPRDSFLTGIEMLLANVVGRSSNWRLNGTNKVGGTQGWDDDIVSLSTITADSVSTAAFKNGTASSMENSSGISPLNFNGVYTIGRYAGNFYSPPDIAELIIYDRRLTTQEREDVEAYLDQKWLNPSAPIPEPSTLLLLGSGLAGMGALLKRRRRK